MITIMIEGKKSFTFYIVVSVREEFSVSPRLVSHAENVIRGACYILLIFFLKHCSFDNIN